MSTQNMLFSTYLKENHPKLSQICSYGIFPSKNQFETALVNEPSMFKPLKFYCNLIGEGAKSVFLWVFMFLQSEFSEGNQVFSLCFNLNIKKN